MSIKHKFGVLIKKSTPDVTIKDMSITLDFNADITPPTNDNEEILYVDASNNLMLTLLDYNKTKEKLLKGILE